jgi:hypothetical protein
MMARSRQVQVLVGKVSEGLDLEPLSRDGGLSYNRLHITQEKVGSGGSLNRYQHQVGFSHGGQEK